MTAGPDPEVALRWWADGELAVAGHVDRLTDDADERVISSAGRPFGAAAMFATVTDEQTR